MRILKGASLKKFKSRIIYFKEIVPGNAVSNWTFRNSKSGCMKYFCNFYKADVTDYELYAITGK